MNLVFAGTPEAALPSLEALLASEHRVLAVITRPDAPSGRGRGLHPSPVAERALELGLPVLRPRRPREPEFVAELTALAPDCVPIVAYGALIPQHVIDIPRHGWVNLHFSLLPAWRGAAPVQHAIRNGDQVSGATTFALVAELDAGPVYDSFREPIGPEDTAGDLLLRLADRGAGLLRDTLTGIESGTLRARPQPDTVVSLAPKITTADAEVHWARPAVELDRLIRACTPAPGAWTTFRGERFKIVTATPVDDVAPVPSSESTSQSESKSESREPAPGDLTVTRASVRVGTGAGSLELLRVQPPGKRPMAAADWARGVTFEAAEGLGR